MLIFIMIVHLHFCHLLPTLLPPLSCHSHSVTLANRLYSCFFIFSILTFFFWTNQSQTIPSVLLKQLEIIFQLLHSLGSSVGKHELCLRRMFWRSYTQPSSVLFVADPSDSLRKSRSIFYFKTLYSYSHYHLSHYHGECLTAGRQHTIPEL